MKKKTIFYIILAALLLAALDILTSCSCERGEARSSAPTILIVNKKIQDSYDKANGVALYKIACWTGTKTEYNGYTFDWFVLTETFEVGDTLKFYTK